MRQVANIIFPSNISNGVTGPHVDARIGDSSVRF